MDCCSDFISSDGQVLSVSKAPKYMPKVNNEGTAAIL